jgi:hypothetical protein
MGQRRRRPGARGGGYFFFVEQRVKRLIQWQHLLE